jgi:7-carboxy-7-deazaguanine synthase
LAVGFFIGALLCVSEIIGATSSTARRGELRCPHNPLEGCVVPKQDTLVVHELYASIQGESSFAGLPCTFVRLTGCNLRCAWCDTPQAFHGGTRLPRSEVLARALATGTTLVELTGGEPLLQPGALPLLRELCDAGRTVLLETSGERDISGVDPRVHRIVDLKAPGSGVSQRNRWENLAHLTKRDELKLVLASRADYEWARDVIRRESLAERCGCVLLSAVAGGPAPRDVVAWLLEDALPVRFQLQLHKVIWGAATTGV